MFKQSLFIISVFFLIIYCSNIDLRTSKADEINLIINTTVQDFYVYIPYVNTPFKCNDVTEIPIEECEGLVALYYSSNGNEWAKEIGNSWLKTSLICSWEGVYCQNGHVVSLSLSSENMRGSLPKEIGNFSQLGSIQIIDSNLTGSLPSEIGNLENLKQLLFFDNQFTGQIPPELGRLSKLINLGLGGNNLTGNIPSELGNMSNLVVFQLHDNQLTGTIPKELANNSRLGAIYLYDNQLSGQIPQELGNLKELTHFHVQNNQLTGEIPDALFSTPILDTIKLNDNQFTGALPQHATNLNLELFWFNNTQLCEPNNSTFQTWLQGIIHLKRTNMTCP